MLEQLNQRFALDDQLRFVEHPSGLVQGLVNTANCQGSFFLLGAHVSTFQPVTQTQPVLFMSKEAVYEVGKPIRGGVPICFPWFGANKLDANAPSHGLVRTVLWDVRSSSQTQEHLTVQLGLKSAPYDLLFSVKFGDALDMQLDIRNDSDDELSCETALHTYFELGDATRAAILGLESHIFRDQLTGELCAATGEHIEFSEETDRVYDGRLGLIEIRDPALGRSIRIRPRDSQSTVVWNPWIAKSKRLSDFGDLEYQRMCCVETANVGKRHLTIAPQELTTVGAAISVAEFGK